MSYGMVLILSLTNVNSSLTISVFGSGTLLELLHGMCSDWESSSATVAIVSVFTVLMYAHGYKLRFSGKGQQNTNYFL